MLTEKQKVIQENCMMLTEETTSKFRNFRLVLQVFMKDAIKDGNLTAVRPKIVNIMNSCRTTEELNHLTKGVYGSTTQIKRLVGSKPNMADKYKSHLEWLTTTFRQELAAKRKDLRTKNR